MAGDGGPSGTSQAVDATRSSLAPSEGSAGDANSSSKSNDVLVNSTKTEDVKDAALIAEQGGERVDLDISETDPDASAADDDNGKTKPLPEGFFPRLWYRTREFFYPSAITEPPRINRPLLGKYNAKLVRLFEKWPRWGRWLYLLLFYIAWIGTMITITYFSTYHSQVGRSERNGVQVDA